LGAILESGQPMRYATKDIKALKQTAAVTDIEEESGDW
jgi:hypothetical protein